MRAQTGQRNRFKRWAMRGAEGFDTFEDANDAHGEGGRFHPAAWQLVQRARTEPPTKLPLVSPLPIAAITVTPLQWLSCAGDRPG